MSAKNQSVTYGRLLTLVLIALVPAFSGALINPTIPAIQNTYSHVPNSETLAQLVSSLSAWIVLIVAPLTGYLLDKYARKPVLLLGVITYGVATSMAFFLDSIYLILLTRVFDGIAVGSLMVTVPTLIADYYSGKRRESVMGYFSAASSGGGVVASLLGGYIASTLGWRYIFLVFAGALLFVPFILRYISEPEVTQETNSEKVGRIEAAVNIVRDNPAWLLISIYALVLLGMLTINLINIEVPFYLTADLGVSDSMVGFMLSTVYAVAFVMALLYGKFKQFLSHVAILAIAFTIASAGFLIITTFDAFGLVYAGVLCSAVGFGVFLPTANDWVASIVDKRYRGRALSGITMFMYGGFALSPFAPDPLIGMYGRLGMLRIAGILLGMIAVALYGFWLIGRTKSGLGAASASD
ncbi:Predicted arabinose efflux permease, MFS family [Halogranum amylolyticum]|uniref:Predicted arabinose efflux permease, MFS family n=1 Tax=Halogranum amylolyticum TaxID=660520 RepID=A0A1H8WCU6_9EURY|nr:MFS transporter [Halogranum amylolyticum]SEP25474.1 Predicted arabinose efflux permease, MFS family [Halogranum amylolyticum]